MYIVSSQINLLYSLLVVGDHTGNSWYGLVNLLKLNATAAGYASYLLYATPLLLGVSWTKQSDRALNCRGRLLVLGISTQ